MKYLGNIFRLAISPIAIVSLIFITANPLSMAADSSANAIIVPTITLLLDEEAVDPTLPVADAGDDFAVLVGEIAQLDGSSSSEPTNLPISYLWSITSKPDGSTATLNDATLINPNFVVDLPGSYIIQLIVNNGIKDSLPDTVSVSNTNRIPLSDAGDNSIVPLAQLVQLDGSSSSDIDGDPLTYLWSMTEKPAGSSAALNDNSLESPAFTPDVKGTYRFDLIVNDGTADSPTDHVEVLAGLELDLQVADVFFGVDRQTTATLSLDLPAPPQGVDITLDVDDTIIDLAASQISYEQGETEKTFSLTGLAVGTTDLRAFGTNISEVSVAIEVSGALISVDDITPLSPSASTSVAISLSDMAPAGGVTINLETIDTAIATVSPSSLFIAEGQFTPAQNAQVMGVGLGNTSLKATGPGFAPDEKAIEVALSAEFDPSSLSVPETLSRDIVLKLDAPAPSGGVIFDLAVIGDSKFGVQNEISIAEGETQSQPITLSGLEDGQAILRASASGFLDTDATITVVDAPDVFLSASSAYIPEAIIGGGLQDFFRFRLEIAPTMAVDVRASVPVGSGVLLSSNSTSVGSDTLVLEDITSTITNTITIQGVSLGDDVPISIEVFEANTTILAGYEPLTSTVDVDPSGVFVSSPDFTMTTFTTNRTVTVQSGVLFDIEDGVSDGTLRKAQRVRAGNLVTVPMQVDNAALLSLPDGATGTLSIDPNTFFNQIAISPIANGVATVSIGSQPTGFNLPGDRDDDVAVSIVAPDAFVRNAGSISHLAEAVVGQDLQQLLYVGLEAAPPNPVDIIVSVPIGSGALLSAQAATVGSTEILLEDVSSTRSPPYYLHGIALGDNVPISVSVYSANTSDPAGYNILASTADVDPSGLFVATSDYNTTTFSTNRSVVVQSVLLYDAEVPSREGERRSTQSVRGGLDLIVPMAVDDVAIASLPAGATDDLIVSSGSSQSSISVDPLSAGQAVVSIVSLPSGFVIPINNDDNVLVTVSAANAYLRPLGSNSHEDEAEVGVDLQLPYRAGLAVTPPSMVDITVSVPAQSGVLLSTDATVGGGTDLLFEDITTTQSPLFYVQGTGLGDDVPVTIGVFEANTSTPIGYNVLDSTVDIDPSGVYISTPDYTTNTFAANRLVTVFSAMLYDNEDNALRDGEYRTNQSVRGGLDLSVPVAVDDDTVVVLPMGASDTLIVPAGINRGTIEVDPLTAGAATVSITAQPNANFTLPTNRDDNVVVTVTAPDTRFNLNSANVGDELQIPVVVSLEEIPLNPVDVTVEIISSAVALISKDNTSAGSASLIFNSVSATSVGTIYVQGLTLNGATQIKVSAPGYNDNTADIQVVSSGFRLGGNFSNIGVGNTRNFTISSARLNANGTFSSTQQVRGGASFDIVATSSLPGVGTVTSPVTLNGGDSTNTSIFTALATGTTNIQITQPAGFTPPVGATDDEITVE